jgi:hypothetical protein
MRLLPQILGVEAQIRIRMEKLGDGKPAFKEWPEPRPYHGVLLSAAPQRT